MKPKWQRARLIASDYSDLIGKLLWVQCGPPVQKALPGHDGDGRPIGNDIDGLGYFTNLTNHLGGRGFIDAPALELLNEFRFDDPPLILFGEWVHEAQPESSEALR